MNIKYLRLAIKDIPDDTKVVTRCSQFGYFDNAARTTHFIVNEKHLRGDDTHVFSVGDRLFLVGDLWIDVKDI